jgi:hypothetical protein
MYWGSWSWVKCKQEGLHIREVHDFSMATRAEVEVDHDDLGMGAQHV